MAMLRLKRLRNSLSGARHCAGRKVVTVALELNKSPPFHYCRAQFGQR